MNKRALVSKIIARLEAELAAIKNAALATHEEATHEENKAEDKYDTRGLEASYLAHGQSKAAEEAAQALAQFQVLPLRDFTAGEPIGLGALVTLEGQDKPALYLVGPRAGGTEIEQEGQTVMVITPQSPLGRQLMGRQQGDILSLGVGAKPEQQRIVAVV
jgi:transcription elongation GreA/GreB family factor